MKIKSHSGYNPCPFCLDVGERLAEKKSICFPFDIQNEQKQMKLRTIDGTNSIVYKIANKEIKNSLGIMG